MDCNDGTSYTDVPYGLLEGISILTAIGNDKDIVGLQIMIRG